MRKGGSQQIPFARTLENPNAGSDPAGLNQHLLKVEQFRVQGGLAPHTTQWEVRKAGAGSMFLFSSDTSFLSMFCLH